MPLRIRVNIILNNINDFNWSWEVSVLENIIYATLKCILVYYENQQVFIRLCVHSTSNHIIIIASVVYDALVNDVLVHH